MKYFWQLGIGVCVGFLLALSVSGASQVVLTALITLVTSLASIISGINKNPPPNHETKINGLNHILYRLDAGVIFFLILGLAVGSILGIRARSHNSFGSDLEYNIKQWEVTGLKDSEIAKKMFDKKYSTKSTRSAGEAEKDIDQTVLFDSENNICTHLCNTSNENLLIEIKKIDDDKINNLLKFTNNPDTLKILIKYMCKCN